MFNYVLIQNKRLNVIGHIFNINSIGSENSSSSNAQDDAMDNHLDGENRSCDSSEYGIRFSDQSEPTEGFLQLEREREEEQGSLDEDSISSRSIINELSIDPSPINPQVININLETLDACVATPLSRFFRKDFEKPPKEYRANPVITLVLLGRGAQYSLVWEYWFLLGEYLFLVLKYRGLALYFF